MDFKMKNGVAGVLNPFLKFREKKLETESAVARPTASVLSHAATRLELEVSSGNPALWKTMVPREKHGKREEEWFGS